MKSLIVKDIKINLKYIFFATIFIIIAPIVLANGEGTNSQFFAVILYFPLLFVNYIIGKFCYLEDSSNTMNFLKSLPISKYKRIGSRYIEGIILVILCTSYCTLIEHIFFIKDVSVSLQYFSISTSIYFSYLGLYLALFYIKDYRFAQQSLNIAFFVFLAVVALFNYFKIDIQFQINSLFLISMITIASILCFLSYMIVCRSK